MIRFFCFIFIIVFICSNISSSQSIEREYNDKGEIIYSKFRFPRCYYRYIKNISYEKEYWLIEFATVADDKVDNSFCEEAYLRGTKI